MATTLAHHGAAIEASRVVGSDTRAPFQRTRASFAPHVHSQGRNLRCSRASLSVNNLCKNTTRARARPGSLVRLRASADDKEQEAPKESVNPTPESATNKPSSSPPAVQSGDYFIPAMVFFTYVGFSVCMGMAVDWDFIFSDVLHLTSGTTEITYNFG
eukprot:CAMPEP_0198199580 /NCGR_PEP_ID=MMETSP1445-20131203/2838_1 /TAXON_ID=36898 /ORGANISM="Pyramimonas sp., Strain CCMP2087" /LENGTH=157 /DNA_ID=CAMNT_0043869457 /DNA_START=33 /DNA_END=506 /DNA_ORIENTATION=+